MRPGCPASARATIPSGGRPRDSTAVARLRAAGGVLDRQDQRRCRPSRARSLPPPRRSGALTGRLVERRGGGRGERRLTARGRQRQRRLDPTPRGVVRCRRLQAVVRARARRRVTTRGWASSTTAGRSSARSPARRATPGSRSASWPGPTAHDPGAVPVALGDPGSVAIAGLRVATLGASDPVEEAVELLLAGGAAAGCRPATVNGRRGRGRDPALLASELADRSGGRPTPARLGPLPSPPAGHGGGLRRGRVARGGGTGTAPTADGRRRLPVDAPVEPHRLAGDEPAVGQHRRRPPAGGPGGRARHGRTTSSSPWRPGSRPPSSRPSRGVSCSRGSRRWRGRWRRAPSRSPAPARGWWPARPGASSCGSWSSRGSRRPS